MPVKTVHANGALLAHKMYVWTGRHIAQSLGKINLFPTAAQKRVSVVGTGFFMGGCLVKMIQIVDWFRCHVNANVWMHFLILCNDDRRILAFQKVQIRIEVFVWWLQLLHFHDLKMLLVSFRLFFKIISLIYLKLVDNRIMYTAFLLS